MRLSRSELLLLLFISVFVIGIAMFLVFRVATYEDPNSEAARALGAEGGESSRYLDLAGNPVSLGAFAGSIRVVSTWASWDPFSRNELMLLAQLSNEFSEDGVVFLAINRKESSPQIEAYLRTIGPLQDLMLIRDPEDFFYRSVGGYAMPETIIYDERGDVAFHFRGPVRADELRARVRDVVDDNEE